MKQAFAALWRWLSGQTRFERAARMLAVEKAQALALAEHIEMDLARVMAAADNFYQFMLHGVVRGADNGGEGK